MKRINGLTSLCLVIFGCLAASIATASELEGTAWRLINIASMDDSNQMPEDPNKYTLEFLTGGTAAMQADCNRGQGSWKSESPGQLAFGVIAATRALCPPDSLSETYLAQFEWIRSYVLKDNSLFLATMADGSILEFAPLPPVVATVLGKEVRASDVAELQEAIMIPMFDRYAAENGLQVEAGELDAYLAKLNSDRSAEYQQEIADLSAEEAAELAAMRNEMGNALIRQWKINRSLYQAYGGRLAYQQFGAEPLDAYRSYLKEREAAGDFNIQAPDMAEAFWALFTDESRNDFIPKGSDDEAKAFATPPWE